MAVALSRGIACSTCTSTHCNLLDDDNSLEMERPGGDPLFVTGCPNKFCGENARQAVRLAAFARKGVLPVGGGLLDQSQGFIRALEIVWSDEAEYDRESKLKIPDE